MSIATLHLTPGWATFGQALPRGAARDGLQLGSLRTQTDVKCRWPDGSIKFAVVTAHVPAEGDYALSAGPDVSQSLAGVEPPYLWLGFQDRDSGTWYGTAFQGHLAEEHNWLDGANVLERRCVLPFWDGDGNVHPFLTAVLDLRQYADGAWRFDWAVENCQDDVGWAVAYDVLACDAAGTPLWSRGGLRHTCGRRWRLVCWWNDGGSAVPPPATVSPDLAPAVAAKALPRYSDQIEQWTDWVWGDDFAPLGKGALWHDMTDHGGRQEIAPYPDWAARYLADPANTNQREYVLAHGDLAGSWPIHFRGADGGIVRVDRRPYYWVNWAGHPTADGPNADLSGCPLTPDVAHQPSLAYVPYLLTGDRYYADEMKFWGAFVLFNTMPEAREYAAGYLHSHETRGYAWGLRNLTDVAAWCPDDDPDRDYFRARVTANLEWLDWQDVTAYGVRWHGPSVPPEWYVGPVLWNMLWQNNYLAWAAFHAHQQGFTGGEEYRNGIIDFQVSWLNDPLYGGDAAPYRLPLAPYWGGPWFRTFADAHAVIAEVLGSPVPFAGYYGIDARLACAVGKALGLPGAQQAHDFAMSRPGMPQYAAERAGYYIL